jgi:hypothetical protein
MKRFVLAGAASLLLAVWLTTTGSTAPRVMTSAVPASHGLSPGTEFTPLAASVLTDPTPVRGTDGRFHLAYELVLTNVMEMSIGIERIDVLDSDTHQVLLSLAGSMLPANMNPLVAGLPPGVPPDAATTIASSAAAIVWLDVQLEDEADIPRRLEHRLVASSLPSLGGQGSSFDVLVARIHTNRTAPVGLGPPVGEGIWLASEGCCSDDTHHRRGLIAVNGDLLVAQRFAIDWFRLDDQHRAWVGDPTQLSSYLSYGEPVIAAADGTVVDALDGLPDSQPPHLPPPPPIEETSGNHVVQHIGPGVFLLYSHLKPGSVRVNAGQSVRRGQVLGQIGTSGNSSTPHLHFQVMTTPTFFPTDSPPFVFERFDLIGQVTERIWDDNLGLQPTGVLPFAPARPPSRHQLEMPLERNVILFSAPADRRIPAPRHVR